MVEETITQIEARIKKATSLNDERKKELLDLLSTLRTEVSHLSKTDAEDAQSIAGFTEVSIHEAIREEKNPKLLDLSLKRKKDLGVKLVGSGLFCWHLHLCQDH